MSTINHHGCGTADHHNRRTMLKAGALGGAAWMTLLAERLARSEEAAPQGLGAKSVILLWMQGGPSQLETFDPHPGKKIAGETKAIDTTVKGVQLAEGMEAVAEMMEDISLVRSVVSKEGDHSRAIYNVKTGFRPDPTLTHPSLGVLACYHLPSNVEIPRHISIRPSSFPGRGGYLGDQLDAFKVYDPAERVPDITTRVPQERYDKRVDSLFDVVESEFMRGRSGKLAERTLHKTSMQAALKMMSSEQLAAFDVNEASEAERAAFGDSNFGRGCLAAARLTEVGVRCVEVTLNGWDTHVNNFDGQMVQTKQMAPGFAALIQYLKDRDRLQETLVICGGEFGRTPTINPAGGRDHWPHGFSIAMAGGGVIGGRVIGETSPEPKREKKDWPQNVVDPYNVQDIHATALRCLGINFTQMMDTPVGRPMIVSDGKPIPKLIQA